MTTQTYDPLLITLAEYICEADITSAEALETARYCLFDTLGCGILALNYPACTKLLGPLVVGNQTNKGCRIPGTYYECDPAQGAFNLGTMVRWLDFNDTWLAAEWGHPSDNLGAILMVADYMTQRHHPFTMGDVLRYMCKAHEIQGMLALENSFNRVGLDHVLLVKIATTGIATHMLGGNKQQVMDALSQAWIDGASLRTYRQAPNTGSRKSWAAGDACRRGVQLALMTLAGEMGYPSALSDKHWGFSAVSLQGKPVTLDLPLDSYVMENILFKLAYPAEFHSQTALEVACQLHPKLKGRFNDIKTIRIETHESAIRIISKQGPLHNPADRDHCLEYIVAIGLLHGSLTADHYEEATASDPRIDALRAKMIVEENTQFSKDYLDPEKRSIANSLEITFQNGETIGPVILEYPIGHRRRRVEGLPVLKQKCRDNLKTQLTDSQVEHLMNLLDEPDTLTEMPVDKFVELWLPRDV